MLCEIYGEDILNTTIIPSKGKYIVNTHLFLCTPCHQRYLDAFFKKTPHRDLPKYINFPWEEVGGNVIYKRLLAGLPHLTSEGVPLVSATPQ